MQNRWREYLLRDIPAYHQRFYVLRLAVVILSQIHLQRVIRNRNGIDSMF